ncbi:MAG: M48 family metallopeptidase [bacterium]
MVYNLIYRKRRSIGIRVEPPGEVTVFAPQGISPEAVTAKVRSKAGWIRRQLQIMGDAAAWCGEKKCVDGEKYLLLGEVFSLRVVEDERYKTPAVRTAGGQLAVMTARADRSSVYGTLHRWYLREADKILRERAEKYQSLLPVRPAAVIVKDQRRRWGSCAADGTLRFNWRLIMAPQSVIDYVVVHELCHLVEKKHGKAFWELVGSIMPEYREHRRWLRENGLKLSF